MLGAKIDFTNLNGTLWSVPFNPATHVTIRVAFRRLMPRSFYSTKTDIGTIRV